MTDCDTVLLICLSVCIGSLLKGTENTKIDVIISQGRSHQRVIF